MQRRMVMCLLCNDVCCAGPTFWLLFCNLALTTAVSLVGFAERGWFF
jgi:hypothetical protein